MGCSDCKKTGCGPGQATPDPANDAPIPRYAYEAAQAVSDRYNKRLIVALIIAIVLFFASNAAWLWAWTSYDYSGEESTVDVTALDGPANYIGGAGTIRNGD